MSEEGDMISTSIFIISIPGKISYNNEKCYNIYRHKANRKNFGSCTHSHWKFAYYQQKLSPDLQELSFYRNPS